MRPYCNCEGCSSKFCYLQIVVLLKVHKKVWTDAGQLRQFSPDVTNTGLNWPSTPKQFDSAGDIQFWRDVCFWLFFSISLLHATKKLDYFFTIVCCTESLQQTEFLFVALSHCNKHNFCLSHWVTATNN